MRTILREMLVTALCLISGIAAASAYDFESGGIYYTIISKTDLTAEVTNNNEDQGYTGNVTIPSTVANDGKTYSVTAIGDNAFSSCVGITAVTIPGNISIIREGAFYGCTGLTAIDIPSSVTTIGTWAFAGCTGLTAIDIPSSVTTIGSVAFSYCTALATITGLNGIISIDKEAFYGSAWEKSQPDGMMYIGTVVYGYKGTMPSNTSIEIKDGTTCIASRALSSCDGLTAITIPGSVLSIGKSAFARSGLTTFTGANSVTFVGQEAFYDTAWLSNQPDGLLYIGKVAYAYKGEMPANTSIEIKNETACIADHAFEFQYNMVSIDIPASVTTIGESAFGCCSGLSGIKNYSSVPQVISDENCFFAVDKTACSLSVPKGSLERYKAAERWNDFANIVEFEISGVETTNADDVKIAANGSEITVLGVDETAQVAVHNAGGQLIYTGTAKTINVPSHGVYIVKVAGVTKKVIL